ncbi:MAG: PilN domain-containing protein [Desulfurivibrionaceae bacterium]|nr:PilN domain-containing protein [Desulfurivibrionaceae bacterium]
MQQRINLVPQKPLAEKVKRLIPFIFGTLLLFLLVLFFLWGEILNNRLAALNSKIAHIEEQASQATELSSQIAALKKDLLAKEEAINHKTAAVARLSKIRGQKKKFSRPLSLIASLLPETIRCRAISFAGAKGSLQGTALDYDDLIRFVGDMQDLPVFKRVSLSVTDRAGDNNQERIQFTILLELV